MFLLVRFEKHLFRPSVGNILVGKGFWNFLDNVSIPNKRDFSCTLRIEYHSSAWEKEWIREVGDLRGDDRLWKKGCSRMLKAASKSDQWLEYVKFRDSNDTLGRWSEDIFSYHTYIDTCSGTTVAKVPIEPLVGGLRHPFAVCGSQHDPQQTPGSLINLYRFILGIPYQLTGDGRIFSFDKGYMLPTTIADLRVTRGVDSDGAVTWNSFFFDLGASLYYEGAGGASQNWFIDTYRQRGIEFDRIIGWEARVYPPERIFKHVPKDVLPRFTYFNVPVNSSKDSAQNPLRFIRALVQKEDFVVLKVDIDSPFTELEIIKEIITDREGVGILVDEIFFEHHVTGSVMSHNWNRNGMLGDIVESYRLFELLRRLGIRAHSWV